MKLFTLPFYRLAPGLLLALSCFSQAAAPATSTTTYSLKELVDVALKQNALPSSHAARAEEKRLSASQEAYWPPASIDVEAGRKSEGGVSGPKYGVALSQPLPLLRKSRLRSEQLKLESESWKTQKSASELKITLNVIQLAYAYVANRRKVEYAEERQKRFQLIESYLAGRVFAAPQRKAESLIVRNRLKALTVEALESRAAYQATIERLKIYAPVEMVQNLVVNVPWLSGQRSLDASERHAKAIERNSDLRAQQLEIQKADIERQVSTRGAWPDPSLVASYEQAKAADTEKNIGLGLSLTLPSWNLNKAGIQSIDQRATAEKQLFASQRQDLTAELSRVLADYEAARQTVMSFPEDQLSKEKAQLRETEAGFRRGQVDLLTFLELENSAADMYTRATESQVHLISKIAEMATLTRETDILSQLDRF